MLKAVIVDDEKGARTRLRQLLSDFPDIDIIRECSDGFEAIETIHNHNPDLLFLDIEMPQMNGFDVIRELGGSDLPKTIFITAHNKYAHHAFDVNAVDYVSKPIKRDRLRQAINKLNTREKYVNDDLETRLEKLLLSKPKDEFIKHFVIKKNHTIKIIKLIDVYWIESCGNYIKIVAENKNFLLRKTLRSVMESIDPDRFYKIHRSAIVNIDYIDRIEETGYGDYIVHMKNGSELKMSRNYKDLLEQ